MLRERLLKPVKLKQRVSCNRLPEKSRKDEGNNCIKKTKRSALHKAIHVCSIHSMDYSFDVFQELKRFLLGDKLKYLLKPDALPSLPAH